MGNLAYGPIYIYMLHTQAIMQHGSLHACELWLQKLFCKTKNIHVVLCRIWEIHSRARYIVCWYLNMHRLFV